MVQGGFFLLPELPIVFRYCSVFLPVMFWFSSGFLPLFGVVPAKILLRICVGCAGYIAFVGLRDDRIIA